MRENREKINIKGMDYYCTEQEGRYKLGIYRLKRRLQH